MAADGQTGHCRRLAAETKGGKGTVWFPCPLLTPPNPPLRRDSLRSRGEMRGAHRDVWCSKSTPLIEAELFAAQDKRPALSGRALLCAASYARKIQGNKASKNLPDARNRAPVTPVSLHISDVSAQRKVRGVKRGQETMVGVLSPLALAGEHRRLRRQTAAILHKHRQRRNNKRRQQTGNADRKTADRALGLAELDRARGADRMRRRADG